MAIFNSYVSLPEGTTFMSFVRDKYNMTIDIFFWDRWFADPLGTK